jgi:hypothetical protein
MANTVIQLKKSSTPSSVPASLEFGELAINYADGKLFYKNTNSQIAEISGEEVNYFGTVNANGVLVIADTPGDILTIEAGDNITIVGDVINDKITISATGGATVTSSDTPPSPALDNQLWFNTNEAKLYIYYNDGDSSQWIEASSPIVSITDNLAFNQANTALSTGQGAFGQANTALSTGQGAFGQANTARTHANAAFSQANTALSTGQGAFTKANSALANATGTFSGSLTISGTLTTTGNIEIGNTSDTTLSRVSAGVAAIEGKTIYVAGGTDVAITDGGTGASTAANARINLLGSSYSLANIVYLTSGTNATYEPVPGTRAIYAEVVGGGGGGGGVDGQGSGTTGIAGAGAGGGYSAVLVTDLNQSFKYTVGSGGSGGAAGDNVGSAGGTSFFYGGESGNTVLAQATGGGGGTGATAAVTQGTGRAQGGVGSVGSLNLRGGAAAWGRVLTGLWATIPVPGSAPFFGGGLAGALNVTGPSGTNYGEGGAGAAVGPTTSDNYAGGSGANGVIRITEFY